MIKRILAILISIYSLSMGGFCDAADEETVKRARAAFDIIRLANGGRDLTAKQYETVERNFAEKLDYTRRYNYDWHWRHLIDNVNKLNYSTREFRRNSFGISGSPLYMHISKCYICNGFLRSLLFQTAINPIPFLVAFPNYYATTCRTQNYQCQIFPAQQVGSGCYCTVYNYCQYGYACPPFYSEFGSIQY